MNDLVTSIIDAYEIRISIVEWIIDSSCSTMMASVHNLDELMASINGVARALRDGLARNCSLRHADFDALMVNILAELEKGKKEIEAEHRYIIQSIKGYLEEQKSLSTCLRERLIGFMQGQVKREDVETAIDGLRETHRKNGQELFPLLRGFQCQVDQFQCQQEEIAQKLRELMDKGEALKITDLKQLAPGRTRRSKIMRAVPNAV